MRRKQEQAQRVKSVLLGPTLQWLAGGAYVAAVRSSGYYPDFGATLAAINLGYVLIRL